MKKILYCSIVLICSLFVCACPDSSPTPDPEGTVYKQTVTLPSTDADVVVTLGDLNTAVRELDGLADWLTVIKQSYISGAPSVRLIAQDNDGDGDRSCVVTVTATSGDKVLLSVLQKKKEQQEPKTGIDDLHGDVTDQPAYSRGR